MKMHIKSLSLTILLYVIGIIVIGVISTYAYIIFLKDIDSDRILEINYIVGIVVTGLVSLASYLVFFFWQRKIANDKYAEYLSLKYRILGGLIASVITVTVFFLFFFWVLDTGISIWISDIDDTLISLLRKHKETTVIFPCIFVAINFFSFIFLKPRP